MEWFPQGHTDRKGWTRSRTQLSQSLLAQDSSFSPRKVPNNGFASSSNPRSSCLQQLLTSHVGVPGLQFCHQHSSLRFLQEFCLPRGLSWISHRIGPWNFNESWGFKDGSHKLLSYLLLPAMSVFWITFLAWMLKALAHVGIFSDDSDFFCTTDNICVSKLFYLPSLPLSSITLSHYLGGLLGPTSGYGLCPLTVLLPFICFWTLMD